MSAARPECDLCKYYYADAGFPWCVHESSDSKAGLHTTYAARYPTGPCRPEGRFFSPAKEIAHNSHAAIDASPASVATCDEFAAASG